MIVLSKRTDQGTLYWKGYLSLYNPSILIIDHGYLGTTLNNKEVGCMDREDAYRELKRRALMMEERGYLCSSHAPILPSKNL